MDQQYSGQWIVWLSKSPQLAVGAEYPSTAKWRLFELFGDAEFMTDELTSI
jgi:hypothetical protein